MSEHQVRIESLAFGGAGIARLDSGKAILVDRAAPQELVIVRLTEDHRSYARGIVAKIIDPSPQRVDPFCPVADRCGGCSWSHLDETAQRSWKHQLLAGELERAGLAVGGPPESITGGAFLGNRTRTRLHRRGGIFGTLTGRSRRVIPLNRCPILAPPLESFARELARWLDEEPPLDLELELYVDRLGRRGLHVSSRTNISCKPWQRCRKELGLRSVVVTGRGGKNLLRQGALLEEDSAGEGLSFEPGLFVQANRAMNAHLVARAASLAGEGSDFIEFYAGVGNITIHLARRFSRGMALEGNRRSARMLEQNVVSREGCLLEVRAETDRFSADLAGLPTPDVVIADPPRAGFKPLWSLLARLKPPRIVLVSCHPMTAIRDISQLAALGYGVDKVLPLDMFPHTPHLELVVAMDLRRGIRKTTSSCSSRGTPRSALDTCPQKNRA